MKPQDIILLILIVVTLIRPRVKFISALGIIFMLLSIPLFYMQIFFTAQHLIWYAILCFSIAIVVSIYTYLHRNKHENK